MARTQTERLWLGGGVAAAVLIAVIGYFFLIGPQRSQTADVQSQVADAQLQETTLQSRIASLTAEQKKLPAYRAAMDQARAALPTADDKTAVPALLRSLQAIARSTSTTLSGLTVGTPTASAAAPQPSSTGTASSAPSSAASSGAAGSTAPSGGLYSVPLTATVNGSGRNCGAFVAQMQLHEPRALLVTGVTIGAGAAQPGAVGATSMTLTMTAFVRPAASTAWTTPAPGGATPSPAASTP